MKQILVSCFILITFPLFAQIKTNSIGDDAINIKLQKDTAGTASRINFSRINIIDARDDTSSVGYFVTIFGVVKKYAFASGLKNELTDWYSNYLMVNKENKTGPGLLVNIKKLRLSNEVTPIINDNGRAGQPNEGWEKGIMIKIEYYLQSDSFFTPLYRYDSIITLRESLRRNADDYISASLKLSLAKLLMMNNDGALLSRKKILYNDILRVNSQHHDLPVYRNDARKKGVYKTFTEFKMNDPSIAQFEFRKGKMGDILYVTENGNEYPTRNVWGYCDGENFFVNSGDKYSKLVRLGYTFYFEGIKSISRSASSTTLNAILQGSSNGHSMSETKFKKELRYYQLDMEIGEAY